MQWLRSWSRRVSATRASKPSGGAGRSGRAGAERRLRARARDGRTARALPFGRQATAWEVAYAAVWMLSGESSYANAHPLVLDGATSFG